MTKTTHTNRGTDRTEVTRNAIVVSAHHRFAEHGYAGTSLTEIADAAGVTKGAIYHHFANKRAVFEAVLDRSFADFTEHVERRVGAAGSGGMRLQEWLDAYVAACSEPRFTRLAFQEGVTALGWSRWRTLVSGRLTTYAGTLLTRARAGAAPASALTVATLVGALRELALSIAESPRPELTAAEARHLVVDLTASLRLVPTPRRSPDTARGSVPRPAHGS